MPNWKKLIVSGSDANLNSLDITTELTASDALITNDLDVLGNVGIGTTSPFYPLHISKNTVGNGFSINIFSTTTKPDAQGGSVYGGFFSSTGNSTATVDNIVGSRNYGEHTGTGQATFIVGSSHFAVHNGSGNSTGIYAISPKAEIKGTGVGSHQYVIGANIQNVLNNSNATVQYLEGAHIAVNLQNGTVTDNAIGLILDYDYTAGVVSGDLDYLRIGNDTLPTVGGTARAINSLSTLPSVFAGNIGIGTTSPSQKLHVDGNARVTGAYYDSGNTPGTVNQILASTATGTSWIDPSTITAEAATLVVIACKNTSGATITKGTPVYQTGTVGATATIEIAPADALISANKLPAIGVLQTDLNNNGFGNVVITGELTNFTTDPIDGVTPTVGDKIFVKSGGGLTLTKPTGEGNGIQNMGLVGKVSSGNAGSITVSSIMRTNDVPNLPEGRIWVGDGNTIVSDTVYIDEPNNRLGIGTITPSAILNIVNSNPKIVLEDSDNTGTFGHIRQQAGNLQLLSNNNTANGTIQFKLDNGTTTTDAMYIASSGNVGIGTTSPTQLLDVTGADAEIVINDSNDAPALRFRGSGVTSAMVEVNSAKDMFFKTGGVAEQMRITSGGNVGIGTTSPSTKLEIADTTPTLRLTDTRNLNVGDWDDVSLGKLQFKTSDTSSPGARVLSEIEAYSGAGAASAPESQLRFKTATNTDTSATTKMTISATGNVGIGTTTPNHKLSVAGGNIEINNGGATWFGSDATGGFARTYNGNSFRFISSANSETMRINNATGNVGIGTTSPTNPLNINFSPNGIANITTGNNSTAWNTSSAIMLNGGSNSNGLGFGVSGTPNDRKSWIQSGHPNQQYANYLGTLAINPLGGNVGIGTTSPDRPLSVVGGNSMVARFQSTNTTSLIQFSNTVSTADQVRIGSNGTNLVLSTNYAERMRIDSLGNVGIGTTSPQHILDVTDSGISTTAPTIRLTNSANYNASAWGGNISHRIEFYSSDPSQNRVASTIENIAGFDKSGVLTGNLVFKTKDYPSPGTLTEKMRITEDGNVGIGTTSPTSLLEISQQLSAASTVDYPYTISSRDDGNSINQAGGEGVGIKFKIAGNAGTTPGDSLVGASIAAIRESATDTDSSTGLGLFVTQNDETLDEAIRIDHDGNVGIGTTNPSFKLDVAGTGNFTGLVSGITPVNAANFVTKAYADGLTPGSGVFLPLAGGTMTGTNGILMPDNFKLKFGDATTPDLEIYHDGSNSFIQDTGIGDLYVDAATNFFVRNKANGEVWIKGTDLGVSLRYQDSQKLITTNTGVTVTGELEATTLDINGNADISGIISGNFVVRSTNNSNADGANFAVDTTNKNSSEYAYEVLRSGTTVAGITTVGKITGTELEGTSLDINGNGDVSGNLTINGGVIANGGITGLDIAGGISGNNYNISGVNQLSINDPGEGIVFSGTTNVQLFTIDDATDSILKITSATALDVNAKITNLSPGSANLDAVNYQQLTDAVAGVLVYQGTWNASTNTPALASGVGTPGYYYIVSTPGSTNLDGITDWNTGDWVIFSDQATDAWQKIDHTNVLNGAGTGNQVTKWSGAGTSYTLADSIVTDNGTSVGIGTTLPGAAYKLEVNGVLKANGGFFTSPVSIFDTSATENPRLSLGRGGGEALNFDVDDRTAIIYHKQDETSGIHKLSLSVDSDSVDTNTIDFNFRNSAGTATTSTPMTILSSGRVGIGVTNPSAKLEVGADVTTNVDIAHFSNSNDVAKAKISLSANSSGELSLIDGSNNTDVFITSNGDSYFNGGDVGIGTTSPTRPLSVYRSTGGSVANFLHYTDASNFAGLYIDVDQATDKVKLTSSGNAPGGFSFYTATSERLTISTAGNIGIGDPTPNYKLDVNSGTTNAALRLKSTDDTVTLRFEDDDSSYEIRESAVGLQFVNSSNVTGVTFLQSGNVGIGTTSPTGKLDVREANVTISTSNSMSDGVRGLKIEGTNAAIEFAGAGNDWWVSALGDGLSIYDTTANSYRFKIMNDGKVGIGTTAPSQLLHVAGNIRVTGEYYDSNNSSGAAGQILSATLTGTDWIDNAHIPSPAPATPGSIVSTIVGETIEIAFNESTTSNIDYYQVWSSDDGGDYGIIAQITPTDFSSTMTVVDTTFVTGGTMSYRVYAVKSGVYSSPGTTSKTYTVGTLDVTDMTVINLNTAYYIQYEKPASRFIDHIEIYMDSQTTQGALNRSNASIVYSGQNPSYMRSVGVSNNFHQFWVEVVTT